jgi:hypothetical protein
MAGGSVRPRNDSSRALPELVRERHDPARPGVNTAEAMKLTGMTRQGVIQAIIAGRLPGYALAGPKNLRWFVFRDAVAPEADREEQLEREAAELRERLTAAENALAVLRATQEQRREAERLFRQAMAKIQGANEDLAAAYHKVAEIADAADDQRVGDWVQPFPPEDA